MPEGDTVWHTARLLHRDLAGQRLVTSDFRVPRLATVDLAGWTVRESASRGKHLLLRLNAPDDRAVTLHSHLRMDGAWRTYPAGGRSLTRPSHQVRVVLRTTAMVAVGYHLHELALVPRGQEDSLVGHLGPDLLGPDWDPVEATRRLATQPMRGIAEALLDQRNLAGIGNIYQAETLFLRGVWPWTPVGEVHALPALVGLAQRLLSANRDRSTRSTTGSLRKGETTYVYGRAGLPCRRCGTLIRKDDRSTRLIFWCPRCQPAP